MSEQFVWHNDKVVVRIEESLLESGCAFVGLKDRDNGVGAIGVSVHMPAAERQAAAQALAGYEWRVMPAHMQVLGTEPPTPKMLREAANILETSPYERFKTAEWLREIAAFLEPEPDPEQVKALADALDAAEEQGDGLYDTAQLARELVRRGVTVRKGAAE